MTAAYLFFLYDTLINHGISNLDEACNICSGHIVFTKTVFHSSIRHCTEDVFHDVLQLGIHLFKGPGQTSGVL